MVLSRSDAEAAIVQARRVLDFASELVAKTAP